MHEPHAPDAPQGAPAATRLEQLPAALVAEHIFSRLNHQEARWQLPLVSKAWRELADSPALWRSLLLDLRFFDDIRRWLAAGPPAWQPLLRKLRAHAPHLEDLGLLVPPVLSLELLEAVLQALGPDPPLLRLCCELYDGPAKAVPLVLGTVPESLRVLCLYGIQGPLEGRCLEGLRRLQQLRVLQLQLADACDTGDERPRLSGGFPSAICDCLLLEELLIVGAGDGAFKVLPEALAHLQRLRSLALLGCGVHGFPQNFAALECLEALHVVNRALNELRALPPSLARLHTLELDWRGSLEALALQPCLRHLGLFGTIGYNMRGEVLGLSQLLHWVALETLSLRFCLLGRVHDDIWRHASLRRLVIRDSDLDMLPPLFTTRWPVVDVNPLGNESLLRLYDSKTPKDLLRYHREFCTAVADGGGSGGEEWRRADHFLRDYFLPALHALPPKGPCRRWIDHR